MNLHLERRLEVLAREIAASKTPKIDTAANALFAEAARKHEHKAPSDWARKINGAAKASTAAEKAGTSRPSPEAAPPNTMTAAELMADLVGAGNGFLVRPAPEPAATPVALGDGLIEGAIYRVKFPSGNVWLSRWQNGEWWGSSGLDRVDILKNPACGGRNDVGTYECLGLEWRP